VSDFGLDADQGGRNSHLMYAESLPLACTKLPRLYLLDCYFLLTVKQGSRQKYCELAGFDEARRCGREASSNGERDSIAVSC